MNRELPEPEGYVFRQDSGFVGGGETIMTGDFTLEQVLAIQKQAYEDGLRDARKAVSDEEILEPEDNADDAYNCGVLDCVRAIDKLTASQKRDE